MIKVFGDDNGELRCSWYFSQKSEELGGLLPSENKPRVAVAIYVKYLFYM